MATQLGHIMADQPLSRELEPSLLANQGGLVYYAVWCQLNGNYWCQLNGNYYLKWRGSFRTLPYYLIFVYVSDCIIWNLEQCGPLCRKTCCWMGCDCLMLLLGCAAFCSVAAYSLNKPQGQSEREPKNSPKYKRIPPAKTQTLLEEFPIPSTLHRPHSLSLWIESPLHSLPYFNHLIHYITHHSAEQAKQDISLSLSRSLCLVGHLYYH